MFGFIFLIVCFLENKSSETVSMSLFYFLLFFLNFGSSSKRMFSFSKIILVKYIYSNSLKLSYYGSSTHKIIPSEN